MSAFALSPCHACGFLASDLELIEELNRRGGAPPSKGSLMVCIACGALSLVDESSLGLYMRELTPEEGRRALADPRVVRVLTARAIVASRRGNEGMRE